MPPLPGEERVLTVFVDVHYYFSAPTQKSHRRFDKGSYLYIYHNATRNKARVEITNSVEPRIKMLATELWISYIYGTQFPTLCTLTVDDQIPHFGSFGRPPNVDPDNEWRLRMGSGFSEKGNELLRIHTLDIYFWTLDDASSFLESAELVLPRSYIETDRYGMHLNLDHTMTAVVQQLENISVTDSACQDRYTRSSSSRPLLHMTSELENSRPTSMLPLPLKSSPSTIGKATGIWLAPEQGQAATSFAPLPYNPAAPAAPEVIRHCEKTPPPDEDDARTNPWEVAAVADNDVQQTQSISRSNGFTWLPILPVQYPPHGIAPSSCPHASPHLGSRVAFPTFSFGSRPSHPSNLVQRHQPICGTDIGLQVSQAGPILFAPPPKDKSASLDFSLGINGQGALTQLHSNTQTTTTLGHPVFTPEQHQILQPGALASGYDIHKQEYRPTEAEAKSPYQKYAQQAMKIRNQRTRRPEDCAAHVESGINRLFQKLEKSI